MCSKRRSISEATCFTLVFPVHDPECILKVLPEANINANIDALCYDVLLHELVIKTSDLGAQ